MENNKKEEQNSTAIKVVTIISIFAVSSFLMSGLFNLMYSGETEANTLMGVISSIPLSFLIYYFYFKDRI